MLPFGQQKNNNRKMAFIKNKGGRKPAPKGTVRSQVVHLRVTNLEKRILRDKAKKAGVHLGTYIRNAALDGNVKSILNVEELAILRDLYGVSNNLNQLTKQAHIEGVFLVENRVLESIGLVYDLIKRLQ